MIYLIEEYDSFCETKSVICAYSDKTMAEKHKDALEKSVRDAETQIKKCYKCPIGNLLCKTEKQVSRVKCEAKDARLNEDYYSCDSYDKIDFEIYNNYWIKEVELY